MIAFGTLQGITPSWFVRASLTAVRLRTCVCLWTTPRTMATEWPYWTTWGCYPVSLSPAPGCSLTVRAPQDNCLPLNMLNKGFNNNDSWNWSDHCLRYNWPTVCIRTKLKISMSWLMLIIFKLSVLLYTTLFLLL